MSTAPHVSKATLCGNPDCQHSKSSHCQSGMPHSDGSDHWISCITEHCTSGIYLGNGRSRWCDCVGFVNPFNGRVAVWKPPTEPDTPCTCGHLRAHHCTKSKDRVGLWVNGKLYRCKHWETPCCTSTSCNEIVDVAQQTYCNCSKFVSPYSRRKKRGKATMPLFEAELRPEYRPRPPQKTDAERLIKCVREIPNVSVRDLAEGSEHSESWVRRTLRRAGIEPPKAVRQKGKP
jgi:hypothetical protein